MEMQSPLWRRHGIWFVVFVIIWIGTRYLPIQRIELSVWFLMFMFFMFPIFGMNELWLNWVKNASRSFVIFPRFFTSCNRPISHQVLGSGPEGMLPPHEAIEHGGSNSTFALRDHDVAIVASRAVEHFGKEKNIRVVHAPLTPVHDIESLRSYFASSVGMGKALGFLNKKSQAWVGLINSLWGEDHPENVKELEKFALKLDVLKGHRETVESEEEATLEAFRLLEAEAGRSLLGRLGERARRMLK